ARRSSNLFLAKNGIIVAGVTAISLTLLFRLGTSRRARLDIDPTADASVLARQVVDFVEQQGAAWSARREVVRRAAMASLEATEALQADGARQLLCIQGSFDEFNLDLEIIHAGPPLPLKTQAASSPGNLLDFDDPAFDDALSQALSGLSNVLLKRMADRVSSGTNGKNAYLRL